MSDFSILAFVFVLKERRRVSFDIVGKKREIKLWKGTTFREINSIILGIFRYESSFNKNTSIEDVLRFISHKKIDDFAYLKFSDSSKFSLTTGCCFDFWEWQNLKEISLHDFDVWLGHSPMASIKIDKLQKVYMWDSESVSLEEARKNGKYLETSFEKFKQAISDLSKDLADFGKRLDSWVEQFNEDFAVTTVKKIKKELGIYS